MTAQTPVVCSVGIRLQGLMQSWAMVGRGAVRGTHTRPTKSGVIGLIANSLGRDWTEDIGDLAKLRFGVRVDDPGTLENDYHTSGSGPYWALPQEVAGAPSWWGNPRLGDPSEPDWMTYAPPRDIAEGKNGAWASKQGNPNLTTDRYLAGADFLAAVEGTDVTLMHSIAAGLAAPARSVFLGRKAYGPASPLLWAVVAAPLEALFAADLPPRDQVDVYVEPATARSGGHVVHDQPITFDGPTRRGARLETHYTITRSGPGAAACEENTPPRIEEPNMEGTSR